MSHTCPRHTNQPFGGKYLDEGVFALGGGEDGAVGEGHHEGRLLPDVAGNGLERPQEVVGVDGVAHALVAQEELGELRDLGL